MSAPFPFTMKSILPVLLGLLLLAGPASVKAQLTYTTNSGAITITGYSVPGGPVGLLNIPASTNGFPVTGIGPEAFELSTNLTSISIPDSVTNFAEYCFFECSNLTGVVISNAAASVGDFAFADCASLTAATMPGDLTNASTAFYGCPNLTSVTITDGSTNIVADEFAFYFTSLASVTIPESVVNIQSNAFLECTSLASVSIPAGVTNIGSEAFLACSNLASVVIYGGLTDIGYAAFVDCAKLTSVTILGSVTNIGESAFELCANLNSLVIHGSVTSIGVQAFYGCSNLAGAAFYGGVASIGQYAFLDCAKMSGVFFGGNAPNYPTNGPYEFYYDRMATIYHYLGTSGWGNTFAGIKDVALKQPSGLLFVLVNGNGTTSPNDNGKVLTLGNVYTITAVPASKDYIFFNWTGGTNLGSSSVQSTNASYKFLMESNLTLQANFVTNLFLAAQGAYNGLFADTNDLTRQQTNSGSFTLNVTSSGSLTGDLYLASATPISFSGKFGPNGMATNTIKRHGASTLTNILTLDLAHQTVGGTLSDGSFVAQWNGNQAVFNSKNKAPYAGQYTVVIPGAADSAVGPYGTSYGTVTVASTGAITFAGSLADGTTVSQSSFVSQDGAWPFYLPLYNGKGSIYGWNYFTNGSISLTTNASWINATNSSATAAYKKGFTNAATVIYGSAYTTNLLKLPDGLGLVVLEGGGLDLAPSITNYISLSSNDKITVTTNLNKMALTINKANGLISGTFANELKTVKVNGVLFQSETNALGYFLGSDQTSGTFTLKAR